MMDAREFRAAALNGRWRALAAPLPNALFALFLGGILGYGAAFASHTLDRFDLVNLIRDGNSDDAFYYFQIAWHMAEGKFSTFDGGITRTNGYHPLWMLLITPFYWMFDKETALFAIKAFEIMLVAGGVSLVAAAAWLSRLPWILLFAVLPALYLQGGMLRGMEAAAGLFMLGLFFFTIALFARDPARWRWPLAVAAFALPWVRLEYAAISLAATAALLLIEWSWQDRLPPGARARSILTLGAVGPFLAAGAGLLAYFGYNGVVFGGIAPVSGSVKRLWSQDYWQAEDGYDLTKNVHDFLGIPAFDDELRIVLGIFVFVSLVWWFARRTRSREGWLLLAFLAGVFGLAAGHLAKFVQSVLTVHPMWGSYDWYFVPAYLMKAVVVPAGCYGAIWFIRRFIGPRLRRASRILILGVVVSGAASLYATADFAAPFRFVDRQSRASGTDWEFASHMGTVVMDRMLPGGSVIGSWDAGVIGYFSRFPVVNLDGLANSWDYFRSGKSHFVGDVEDLGVFLAGKVEDLGVFKQRFGITHFANMLFLGAHYVEKTRGAAHHYDIEFAADPDGALLFRGPPIDYRLPERRQFVLWTLDLLEPSLGGSNRSDWIWERMDPHFERRIGDGIGLLVDGRRAQAFARDCTPGDQAVWTWTVQEDESACLPWTQAGTGLCASSMVLPRDASDVRVTRMTKGEFLAGVAECQPSIRSDFEVYVFDNRLVYRKEPCGSDDVGTHFFLHVVPVSRYDLSGHRRPYGFDNLDFNFAQHGVRAFGKCSANLPLPSYDIAAIRTGQSVRVEDGYRTIWMGEIRLE